MNPTVRLNKIFFLLILLTAYFPGYSQIDKEFWFVGPEASSNHGDRPVFIRISTMDDPANINLRMPANNKFVPVISTIPANSTISIQLDVIAGNTTWLDSIENRPADRVLNKGLLLTSDNYVTAYYEINNGSNPAIFPFKGKNGVGTEFFISGQTDYANQTNDGSEAFDIVATQDTTTITITPSIAIVGHAANVPFVITLHKGQTYSARTLITTASASLAGSHVVSDKPIAITISDDSIITGGWDIIGDQIIPINLLGWEYIVIKGFADNNPPGNDDERAYITATQDATDIMMDGNPVPIGTINIGQQFDYAIPNTTNTACIKATKPVYVYHLSGHPGEAGASILPQDSCTGSRKIGFNRSSTSAFALLILTRSGNEGFFILNGNATTISAANFNPVPGTSGNWMYYRQNNLTTAQVPVGANLLENTNGKFHLGILNNVAASSEYGYFSDFSTLYLGANSSMCPGDSLILDGGPYRSSYDWKKLIGGLWTQVGTNRTYTVKDSGYYACQTNGDFCSLMDTIRIDYYPNGTVSLGPNRTICQGTTTTFTPGNFVNYLWSTMSTSPTLTTGQPGEVWVRVTNNNGCIARDTVMIYVDSLPKANSAITGTAIVCQGQNNVTYNIDSLHFATSYAWTLPPGATGTSTTKSITLNFSGSAISGPLTVHGSNACGIGPEISFPITVDPLPLSAGLIAGPANVCQGQNGVIFSVPPITNATSYLWTLPPGFTIVSGAGTPSMTLNVGLTAVSGPITVTGHNNCGDGSTSGFSLIVKLFPTPAGPITGATTVCQGQQNVVYSTSLITGANSYLWTLPTGAVITSGVGTNSITISFDSTALSGNLTVKGHSIDCGDGMSSMLAVTVNPLPAPAGTISGTTPVCQGQSGILYSIPVIPYATTYLWTIPSGCAITIGAGTNAITTGFNTSAVSGQFIVQGHNPTCGDGRRSTLNVTLKPLPLATGNILGTTPVCQGESNIPYSVQNIDPLTTFWIWNLIPSTAGTISGSTAAMNINWDNNFTGTATLQVKGQNGCGDGVESPQLNLKIDYKPNVIYLDCGDLFTTKNARPVLLCGGYPFGPGGIYSGTGVSPGPPGSFVFDPATNAVFGSAGGTPYTITYRYTNVNNCFREATKLIKVYPSNAAQPCPGTLADVRDGKTYATFLAGSGSFAKCWMAENLNYGVFSDANLPQTDNCLIEKYCLNNISAQCTTTGGYYQWQEVMNYNASESAQGICPPGWHVPSQQEWTELENFYLGPGVAGGGMKDMFAPQGFHGLLSGVYYLDTSWKFTSGNNSGTIYWSSTSTMSGNVVTNGINSFNPSTSLYPSSKGNAFPVRCVRD